jgi:hypothetical protein
MLRTMILLGALAALTPATASADCPDVPTHVLLGRQCVSERGWRTETNDCAAFYETALEHARLNDLSIRAAICDLSSHVLDDDSEITARRWLLDLDEDGHRPEGLRVPWTVERCSVARVWVDGVRTCPGTVLPSRRDAWLTTLDETGLLVAGRSLRPVPVCASPPRAWGSDADLRWRARSGFAFDEVDCGETVNHFGRVRELPGRRR